MFTKEDFDLLAPMVEGFSLMTYDYPNYGRYETFLLTNQLFHTYSGIKSTPYFNLPSLFYLPTIGPQYNQLW